MSQILQRMRPNTVPLLVLADGASLDLEASYNALQDPAFLFEYKASGQVQALAAGEYVQEGGLVIALRKSTLSDAELDAELIPQVITRPDKGAGDYLHHQQLFAIAEWTLNDIHPDTDGAGYYNWELHFNPHSKGGIPFSEGVGWELVILNRQGSSVVTGAFCTVDSVMVRFAWGGF